MAWQKAVGVGEAGIAGNAFGQPDAVRHGQVLEKFLRAFVRVEQAQLQVEHRLARHAEKEMPRLDDAGVNRADRHLKHAFAFDLAELVPLAAGTAAARCANRSPCAADRLPASRRAARSGAGWDGRSSLRPNRSWISRSCQLTAGTALVSEGKLRFVRRHRHAQDEETVRPRRAQRRNRGGRRFSCARASSANTLTSRAFHFL